MDQKAATPTAGTQQTEPEVVAAISSGDGQIAKEGPIPERAYAIWGEEGRPEGRHRSRRIYPLGREITRVSDKWIPHSVFSRPRQRRAR